jgi:hypothetical protein
MSRFSAVAAVVLAFLSVDASALTLEPLPGTTPQETCFSCVFPNGVGVIARDASGQPAANVPVTFTTQADTLGMVHFDDTCCVAHESITVPTGPDGIARATAVTHYHPSSSGVVTASAAGAADAVFNLSSTARVATRVEFLDQHLRFVQVGTNFESPWRIRALDANGQAMPWALVTFYVGNWGGEQATASFPGSGDMVFIVADANGIATSPIAHSETIGTGEGFVIGGTLAPPDGEAVPWSLDQYVPVAYSITSRSATLVGTPPDSVQLQSISAAPYVVRVLDASGAPAVGKPVYFRTDGVFDVDPPRCMSFLAQGSGDEVIYTDANGLATPSVLYGEIPGACPLRIWIPGVSEPIRKEVWVFDPSNVVVTPRQASVTSVVGKKYRVTLDFSENGRKVQPGVIEWVEAIRPAHGPAGGFDGQPVYTFANNSAVIELQANRSLGEYDLDIAYTVTNHARVHVKQKPK